MCEIENLYPKEAELTGDDDVEIVNAILSAYPNKDFLSLRLRHKMGINVADEITTMDGPGRIIVTRIYDYAKAAGRALELLAITWTDKPGNPKLKSLADRFFPEQQAVINKFEPHDTAAPPAPRPPLERLVDKRSKFTNLAAFAERLQTLSGALCRISIPEVSGTGFLIGRRTVLTNFHVVKRAIQAGRAGDQIKCEFDFHSEDQPTIEMFGKPAEEWQGPNSPYSDSDLTGQGNPAEDELDFAVIHLENEVEDSRNSIAWPVAPPIIAQRDFVLIGQHPEGHEAQLAMGEVVEFPQSGLRYRYDVTTEGGSSGSPVFNFDLELVALHHAADPAHDPEYNQGVPIWKIMKAIKAEGLDLETL